MPTYLTGTVRVSVPATSANLGPGFDSLGIALDLRDTVRAEIGVAGMQVVVRGVGADTVPRNKNHLVYKAMCRAFAQMGCRVPAVSLHCENLIPHGRGLGSSSAAIVSGLFAARALVVDGSVLMDDMAAFDLAARMEGHPDNVAAAIFGGCTVAYADDGRFRAARVGVDPRIHVVVFVPPDPVSTQLARGLLPDLVSHAIAASNSGRAALLVAALTSQPELLLAATEDRLHQDFRETAMPGTLRLVRDLRGSGIPAAVSGAGPTVLAFADASSEADVEARVPAGWRAIRLPIDRTGVLVDLPTSTVE